MTEKYTPEKVAELVTESRDRAKFLLALDEVEAHFDGQQQNVLADALAAVSAERDAYKRAKTENDERFMIERDEARADRDRLHKAITEALAFESVLPAIATEPRRILRAALDKEGEGDE